MFLNQKPLMTNFKNYYIILFSFVLLFGCQDDIPKAYKKKSYQKEVIVFYPSWKQHELAIHDIPWDKITRIIYAFAAPNEDGSLNTSNLKRLSPLVLLNCIGDVLVGSPKLVILKLVFFSILF